MSIKKVMGDVMTFRNVNQEGDGGRDDIYGNSMGDVMTFRHVNRERDGGRDDILERQSGT
jgi:hypothetical protein